MPGPDYNYTTFIEENIDYWMNFSSSPALGEPVSDFTLTSLEGQPVQLADYWRSQKYLIIEFGSFT